MQVITNVENLGLKRAVFETLVSQIPGGVIVVEAPSGKLLSANDGAERIWRRKVSGIANVYAYCRKCKAVRDDSREYRIRERPLVRSITSGEVVKDEQFAIVRGDATRGAVSVVSAPIYDCDRNIIAGIEILTDITERRKEEALYDGERQTLEMIAGGAPLSDVLTNIIRLIESQSDGMLCSILLLADDGLHVRHGAAPSLPELYVKAIDGAPIGPRAGSCGTAMYRGEQVIVTDILADPLWADYRDLAQAFRLRACWSTPILSHTGKVLGSFAMYYHEPRSPNPYEMQLTRIATHVTGIAIERRQSEDALRRLAGQLITAQEEERQRIARELHDDLVQTVASLAIGMSRVRRKLPVSADSAGEELASLQTRISGLADHIRQLSHQLHPAVLEHAGLIAALQSFVAEFSRLEGVDVALTCPETNPAIPPDVGLCTYRLVQESLRNVAKHSGVKCAEVSLEIREDHLHVTIRDHGRGFDTERTVGGLGMVSLQERVRLCHGGLEISSHINGGTIVTARIPLGG
jgi:signal transduction histidine kinase